MQSSKQTQKAGVMRADLKPHGGSPSPLCLRTSTFTSPRRDKPPFSIPPSPTHGSWRWRGLKIEPAAAAAGSCFCMQPQSLQHTITKAEEQTVAAAGAGYLCYALNRSDGRSDGAGFCSTVVVVVVGRVLAGANSGSKQYNGMFWGNKGLVQMLSQNLCLPGLPGHCHKFLKIYPSMQCRHPLLYIRDFCQNTQ